MLDSVTFTFWFIFQDANSKRIWLATLYQRSSEVFYLERRKEWLWWRSSHNSLCILERVPAAPKGSSWYVTKWKIKDPFLPTVNRKALINSSSIQVERDSTSYICNYLEHISKFLSTTLSLTERWAEWRGRRGVRTYAFSFFINFALLLLYRSHTRSVQKRNGVKCFRGCRRIEWFTNDRVHPLTSGAGSI